MARRKRPRQRPILHQQSGPSVAWESPPFRKKIRLVNAAVIAASVAIASILPAQPSHTPQPVASLKQSNVAELLHSALSIGSLESTDDVEVGLRQASGYAKLLFGALNPEREIFGGIEALGSSAHGHVQTNTPGARNENLQLAELLNSDLASLRAPIASPAVGTVEVRLAYRAGTIERSLFEENQELEVSDPLLAKLMEIFSWDIDFALDAREGDSFVAVHEERYWFGRKISDGPIIAAEFVSQGRSYRAIGFRENDGRMEYFTPEGRALKRAFLRTPVLFSSISSRFSNARYHPILKTWRAHNGVDYSASVGTPVRATASGRVLSMGRNGGYGNTVVIRHDQTYSTLYAHLSHYQANLRPGDYVEQGDVIGFVGQTGLATGPHLHYEFQVDGKHQNPLTFKFPEGQLIAPALREEFLRTARTWTAQLDAASGRHLAAR